MTRIRSSKSPGEFCFDSVTMRIVHLGLDDHSRTRSNWRVFLWVGGTQWQSPPSRAVRPQDKYRVVSAWYTEEEIQSIADFFSLKYKKINVKLVYP